MNGSEKRNYSSGRPDKSGRKIIYIMKYLSKSPSQTKKIGQSLAYNLLKVSKKKTLIIGLEGDLGGGKTTFLQGFAKGLKINKKILSPTFVIIKKFSLPKDKKSGFKYFYHIDCYRIKKPKEILDLGFKKIISNSENIVAIEWVNQIKKVLPKDIIYLKFKFIANRIRYIEWRTACYK